MDAVSCHVVVGEAGDEVVLQFVADVERAGAALCVCWDFVVEPFAALFDGADDEEVPEVVGAVEEVFNSEEVLACVPCGGCGFRGMRRRRLQGCSTLRRVLPVGD